MKNTTQRVWSILLTICMLMGLLSMAAFAEDTAPVITTQPEYDYGWVGESLTLSVEATGEGTLTYQWYVGETALADEDGVLSGTQTAELTVYLTDCNIRNNAYYCVVTDENSNSTQSNAVSLSVNHGDDDVDPDNVYYYYNEATHRVYCSDCDQFLLLETHSFGDDTVCDACGYDTADPVEKAPIKPAYMSCMSVDCGDEYVLTMEAYGLNLKYKWSYYDDAQGDYVAFAESENVKGTNAVQLTLKKVTCDMDELEIVCEAWNTAGSVTDSTRLDVMPVSDGVYVKTASGHSTTCICGEAMEQEPHSDANNDRVCDECNYAFVADSPIITAHPKDSYTKNGEDAKFTVSASGKDLTYQWYCDGMLIDPEDSCYDGADTATLTVYSFYDAEQEDPVYDCWYDGETYYCVVSNAKGTVRSKMVERHVEHVWSDEWHTLEYTHFHACLCGRYEGGYHADTNDDHVCDSCGADFQRPFKDVSDPNEWYYDAAMYNYIFGIFTGEYGNFLPKDPITRGEMATVLARVAFTEDWIQEFSDEEFEDMLKTLSCEDAKEVSDIDGYFYERQVRLLCAIGVVKGYEDGTFRGETEISRQELAIMLQRFVEVVFGEDAADMQFGEAVKAFKDADQVDDWAAAEVEWCRRAGIFRGDDDAYFHPEDDANRAEVAQTLMRMGIYPGIMIEE